MDVKLTGYRKQRTIARPVEVMGIGFVTGATIHVRFRPAEPNSGVVFVRTDLKGSPTVAARVANVTATPRRTVLGTAPAQVELVEHVLSALAGLRIDNCTVELNGSEAPGMDGSARNFVEALCRAGTVLQPVSKAIWGTDYSITVNDGPATITLHPGPRDHLRVTYILDYGRPTPIHTQRHTHDVGPEGYLNGIHDSRTFLLLEEAEALHKQGLGSRTDWSDLVVFGPHGPIRNRLRYADEPARHKVLDIVGDLSLFGHDLCGHVVACRSGHALNVALARRLHEMAEHLKPPDLRIAA